MLIRYMKEIDFSNCKTPKEFGEQLSRPTAGNRLNDNGAVVQGFDSFRRAVGSLLMDTDHEFDLSVAEWEETYDAWVTACARRNR